MVIHFQKGAWVAESNYAEKDALKRAGWWWHGQPCRPGCKACAAGLSYKVWWTPKVENAALLSTYADETAKAAMAGHVEEVEASRAAAPKLSAEEIARTMPSPPDLSYLPYQMAGILWLMRHAKSLLADAPGLGKTIQVLGAINAEPAIKSVLVICPASLRLNWARESVKWLVRPRTIQVVDTGKIRDKELAKHVSVAPVPGDAEMVIVNYDRLGEEPGPVGVQYEQGTMTMLFGSEWGKDRADRTFAAQGIKCATAVTEKKRIAKPTLPPLVQQKVDALTEMLTHNETFEALMTRKWDLMVIDESHMLKSKDAHRTHACYGYWDKEKKAMVPGLADRSERLWALTGTPIPNRPVESHSTLSKLDPQEFGNWKRFVERYCDGHQEWVSRSKQAWVVDGASRLDELQEKLRGSVMIRRLKEDVLKELPAKRRQIIVLPLNGASKAVEAENAAFADHEDAIAQAEAEMALATASDDPEAYSRAAAKLAQGYTVAFTECSAARHRVALAKVPAAVEHIKNMLEGGTKKIVVFAHHRDVEDKLVEGLAEYHPVMLRGGDSNAEKDAAITTFQTDPECRVFVGAISAAGVGITLTAASTVVFVELSWVPGEVTQAEDRCHRIGQHDNVLVQHLVFDGSMDAKMVKTLVAKQAVADAALDNSTAVTLTEAERMASVSKEAWLAFVKANMEKREEERKRAAAEAQMSADARAVHRAASKLVGDIEVADELRALVHEAVREIAVECDGALAKDGVGFNKADSYLGRGLAALPSLNDRQAWLAVGLARRYRRQLGEELRDRIAAVIGDTLEENEEAKANA
jgi:SNF2 family DNA or RNA helicase